MQARSPVEAEVAAALAWDEGASGIEEHEDGCALTIYAPRACSDRIREALASAALELRIGDASDVDDTEWSEAWKQGLEPIVVSPRLVVRPSFREIALADGQVEIEIDPGQAFGTGAHASTFLALACLDDVLARRKIGTVLDVGTGSGVLALCALRLGARRALGFDLDALAAPAARAAARANGLAQQLDVFTGGIEALGDRRFDLVVANLLRSELLPIAEPVAARVAAGGALVVSGLLARDEPAVAEAFAACQSPLAVRARRERADADGESWIGLVLERSARRDDETDVMRR